MKATYDSDILSHYRSVAEQDGLLATSTMADSRTRQIETELILGVVGKALETHKNGIDLFDVGCGNGYTLSVVASQFPGARCRGFEYTPELAALARQRFEGQPTQIHSADIRNADWSGGQAADVVIVQRVLINLLDPEHQRAALRNIVAAVRPRGVALFVEAFQTGLDNLNRARAEFDLAPIPPAHHNLLLQDDFFAEAGDFAYVVSDWPGVASNFLSTHYFVTRVLHPLMLGTKPFTRNSDFVQFMSASLRPNIGDYSPMRATVLVRR